MSSSRQAQLYRKVKISRLCVGDLIRELSFINSTLASANHIWDGALVKNDNDGNDGNVVQ